MEFALPEFEKGQETFAFLAEIERRYRRERLRAGSKAKFLADEEEAGVVAAAQAACEVYAAASEDEREKIRNFFRQSYSLRHRLNCVAGQHAQQFGVDGSVEELRRALIALSLEDGQTDARDTFSALIGLRERSNLLRIDADKIFENVGQISSRRMQRLLRQKSEPVDLSEFAG